MAVEGPVLIRALGTGGLCLFITAHAHHRVESSPKEKKEVVEPLARRRWETIGVKNDIIRLFYDRSIDDDNREEK